MTAAVWVLWLQITFMFLCGTDPCAIQVPPGPPRPLSVTYATQADCLEALERKQAQVPYFAQEGDPRLAIAYTFWCALEEDPV